MNLDTQLLGRADAGDARPAGAAAATRTGRAGAQSNGNLLSMTMKKPTMTKLPHIPIRIPTESLRGDPAIRQLCRVAVLLVLSVWLVPSARAVSLDTVVKEQAAADKAAVDAQAKIDRLEDQTKDMAVKYSETLALATSLEKYGDQLATQLESQNTRLADIKKQLAGIEVTQRNITPLIEQMIATLEKFVSLDVPFLVEERTNRVATLKQLLARSDVSTSEKYRRTLEAYQIEMEYGRTLDAYLGKLGDGDSARTVQFLRLGRIALAYQTPDGQETGYWDAGQKKWIVDEQYDRDVKRALAVAKKEGAPDLVMLPIPAPEEVSK